MTQIGHQSVPMLRSFRIAQFLAVFVLALTPRPCPGHQRAAVLSSDSSFAHADPQIWGLPADQPAGSDATRMTAQTHGQHGQRQPRDDELTTDSKTSAEGSFERPLGEDSPALRGRARAKLSSTETCMHHMHSGSILTHKWMTSEAVRQRAQVNPGDPSRLRAALARYTQGQNLTVSFLGGSITAGQGAVDGKAFPYWAEDILTEGLAGKRGGSTFHVHNGAVPGTMSSYMSVCHNVHVPKETDIIFLDYTLNDPDEVSPLMDNPMRRPFERLIRKLLNYPRRPAVILIHAYRWYHLNQHGPLLGNYYKSCDSDFHNFALYYGLQELSVKAAAWNLMRKGAVGFIANYTRADHTGNKQKEIDASLKGKVFYWDILHPDGQTGHKFMGEISAQILLDALVTVTARPMDAEELALISEPLPPPMLPGNWESASDKCFIGLAFAQAVLEHELWIYRDEGKTHRPKLGYITDQPGAKLKIQVDSSSASGKNSNQVTVEISYLKSYVNMGKANVQCTSGCSCDPTEFDGHTLDKTSLLNLHEFKVSQHVACVITITVLPGTSSGKHKVKISGIVISEEGFEGIRNNMAIDMVMEGVSLGKTSAEFDIKTWVSGRR